MAEILQGEIKVAHTIEKGVPTSSGQPTETKAGETNFPTEKQENAVEEIAEKGTRKLLGMTSVKRRLANYAISALEGEINRSFDSRLFYESLYGDKRSMAKIQNQKAIANNITTFAKSTVGAAITWVALSNPIILGLHLTNSTLGIINTFRDKITNRQQFEERRSIELYETSKRRERIIADTFNRR